MSEPTVPVVAVTILEDRASVTRRGAFAVAAGQTRITITGVSPVLADKTVTATATGARVLDAKCVRTVVASRGSIHELDEDRAALAAELATLEARVAAAHAEATAVAQLIEASLGELAVAAARGNSTPNAAEQLAALDDWEAPARRRIVDAERERALKQVALDRLDARITRAKSHTGDEVAALVVELIADAATEVVLAVSYVVPGAAWRPYHRATLARTSATGGTIAWQTAACVWQATGEDWTDVELTCSLERASLGVEPPDLADDELRARRKPDTVVVESREHEHQTTGLGGGPLEVPGIDDGGLGLTLSAKRATVRADGTPHRIPVAAFTSLAQLALVAIPLRSPWVHLRAQLTNAGTIPLLAGPVDLIMDSGLVGRAEVGFVAPGEKLHVGFGPEPEVRVHRSEVRERDDAGLLGGWNVQTIKVAVRLSNLGAKTREVAVTERVPKSEVEQVEIVIGAPDAYLLPDDEQVTPRTVDDRGMVTWTVTLPPLGRRAVTLEYRVRSQRGVAGM